MVRSLFLLFGGTCYLLFLGVFLYAIGFVIGWGVPKHIDSGTTGNLGVALLVDVALLGLFAVQHSLMARPAFKRRWTRFVPPPIERSTYVLFSSLALAALFAWWRPLPTPVWQVDAEPARLLLYGLYALGWLIVLTGTFLINHFDLFGLRQVWLHARHQPCRDLPFVTRAYYRVVRHPLMLGFLIAFWATPDMSRGHLLFAAMTTGYILVAVKFLEERDLVAALGNDYRAYQRRVPMLLPRLWPRRKDTAGPAIPDSPPTG